MELEIEKFAKLFLGILAKNSKNKNNNCKTIELPNNYKQNIENILCANNGWCNKFSQLINIEEYFEDHFFWELKLSICIKKILEDFNKEIKYNLEYDFLEISFSLEEIEMLLKDQDEELINLMIHFTDLLTDLIYTRIFQEEFYDYSANAVKKMHELYKEEINGYSDNKKQE